MRGIRLLAALVGLAALSLLTGGAFSTFMAHSGGASYVGVGDLSPNSMVSYWALRCYKSAGTNVPIADITDSSTGNTTGTRLVCNSGGVVSSLVSGSACTFVTGNACSPLATTCASACDAEELYDQVGTYHFIQATNANRPTVGTTNGACKPSGGTFTGSLCLLFTAASSQYMETGATTAISQTFDFSATYARTALFTTDMGVFAPSSTCDMETRAVANLGAWACPTLITPALADSAFHAVQLENAGANGAYAVNAAVTSSQNAGTNASLLHFTLGAQYTPGAYLSGTILEAYITSAANGPNAGTDLFPTIGSNIQAYWGF